MRALPLGLRIVAGVLALLALLVLATGGGSIGAGPIRISVTSPGRTILQAALCWLVATLLASRHQGAAARDRDATGAASAGELRTDSPSASWRRLGASVPVAIVLVALAAVADSHPQRVGDGVEYVAMAMNLARLQPPALSPADAAATDPVLDAAFGFENARVPPGIVGRDGRRDMYHFWGYSALVAPGMALARAVGVHWNYAFAFVNGLLLLGLLALFVRRRSTDGAADVGAALAAALLLTGPPLWWLDKAHAEVFLFVTIAVAVVVLEDWPWLALGSAGLAAAQNPVGILVLGPVSVFVLWRAIARARAAASDGASLVSSCGAVALGVAIAASAPLYYLWHLGTWSPLTGTVSGLGLTVRALVTPLVDLNLGLVWHAPVLVGLAVLGVMRVPAPLRLLVTVVTLTLLAAFATVGNVNHGGTPGMSRYALWLLAAWTPLVVSGAQRLARAPRPLLATVLLVSVTLTWFLFRPTLADRSAASPNELASFVWRTWPSLENPLTEVFAERLSGLDGAPPIPIATPGCEKALTLGSGREAQWPFPCAPRPVPPACTVARALCYVNGDAAVATSVPAYQVIDPDPPYAWTTVDRRDFDALLAVLGRGAQHRRSTGPRRRIVSLEGLDWSYIVEGELGTVAWVRARVSEPPVLRIRVERHARVEVRGSQDPPDIGRDLPAGEHDVALPGTDLALVVIAESE